MTVHLTHGGSTAARTLACPAWASRSKHVKPQEESAAAKDGSLKHLAMENLMLDDLSLESQVGKTTFDTLVLEDRHLYSLNVAKNALDKVLDVYQVDDYIVEPFIEYIPGVSGGSVDLLGFADNDKTLVIIDYKFGARRVEVAHNKQVYLYTLAAITDKKYKLDPFEKYVGVIIQPEVSEEPQIFEFTNAELQDFKKKYDAALKNAETKHPRAMAGSHCGFCPVAPTCKEKQAHARSALMNNPKDMNTLSANLDMIKDLKVWVDEVEKYAIDVMMKQHADVQGWKVVKTRPSTTWSDEDEAASFLEQEIGPEALRPVTVAKANR